MTADLRNGTGGGRYGRPGPRPRIVPWLLLGLGLTLEMPVALADNLITNGDLESGDLDFQSQYSNGCLKDIEAGCYKVTTSPFQWHAAFDYCGDHTRGDGYMLLANGASEATYVWQQTVTVTAETNYLFTAYARTVYPDDANPANLRIQMDTASGCGASNSFEDIGSINAPLGSSVGGPSCYTWTSNYAATSITSGGSTSICIRILNDNTADAGNDFALDDISLVPDTRVTETVDDTGTTSGTTPVTIDVLANDRFGSEGLDGNTLDLEPGVGGVQSSLVITGVGTFTVVSGQYGDYGKAVQFTPVSGFSGEATATYRISTISGIPSTVATITVTVDPVCGPGIALTVGPPALWQQLALPCEITGTVGGVLGGAPTEGQLDDDIYGNAASNGWLMYGNDVNNDKNLKLDVTDDLLNGTGYWIKSFAVPVGGTLKVTGDATGGVVTALGCTSANGCKVIPLTYVAGKSGFNLVGNPFPYRVRWADVRVRVGGASGSVHTPSEAAGEGVNVLSKQIWLWEQTQYATYDDATNPGYLPYFSSFWVRTLSGAAGKTVELLIPASASPLGQAAPRRSEPASPARSWYLGWLDWLIPIAAADDFPTGRHPAGPPTRGFSPPPAAAPRQIISDPTLDLLTTQGIVVLGLDPAAAAAAAHVQAAAEGQEWTLRLKVDEPATGYKDYNSLLGQRLDARDGYDAHDLTELAPFSKPYLTLLFPRPGWGAQAGNYATDFRAALVTTRGKRPVALPAADWPFEIRSDRPGTKVILRWEGDPVILARSRLVDPTARKTINPTAKTYAKGYPVTLTTGTRAFTWRFLGLGK